MFTEEMEVTKTDNTVTEVWGRQEQTFYIASGNSERLKLPPKISLTVKLRCQSALFSVDDKKQFLLIHIAQRMLSLEYIKRHGFLFFS